MNKIRVIDLLNKIANGEEFNKRIRYVDVCGIQKEYEATSYDIIKGLANVEFGLNKEIEIIEEPKKIEKLEHIKLYAPYPECSDDRFEVVEEAINKIIDYINSREDK